MADPNSRLGRELQDRDSTLRTKQWTPPQKLPSPDKREGWTHRWIRVSIMGQSDPTNVSSSFREGWEACKYEEYPELMMQTSNDPRYKGNIEIGGLLLCRIPSSMYDQRENYYRKQAEAQVDAVDNSFMRQEDKRTNMKLFADRQSSVTFGSGRGKTNV
jgi:hypothetical protein